MKFSGMSLRAIIMAALNCAAIEGTAVGEVLAELSQGTGRACQHEAGLIIIS